MVLLPNMKNSKTPSLGLSSSTLGQKPLISFSDLLKGIDSSKDAKVVQNGSLVLMLASEQGVALKAKNPSLKEVLPTSLAGEQKIAQESDEELLELNPQLVTTLSKEQRKELVQEAKNYLKSKIQESDGYKKAQIQELPTTLKGLVEAAKTYGIDISKITFEEVRVSTKEMVQESLAEMPKEGAQEKKEPKTQTAQEIAPEKKETKTQTPQEMLQEKKETKSELPRQTHETSLFRAQSMVQHTPTEQIVQAKTVSVAQKTEQKAPRERAEDTLSLLLRGEKPSSENPSLTGDFSVASAKVIAPKASGENKNLEQFLQGESFASQQNETQSAKMESLVTHKAESLEVKMNEAKQMIKYLSNDVKNAMDDYRSPFTRVKVQLNPQNLGEVDLTVVQRGKNLHVNISSNNTAIQTLSMNINELRVQLNNNGINNAIFNFSSGSQSGDASANAGQQQRQNEQKAHQEYNYFENEETREEVLSSLEIIVPRYI